MESENQHNQQQKASSHKNRITTRNQFEKLVELLEESSYLITGQSQSSTQFGYSKAKADTAWENIADSLNNIGPPRRTVYEWKKTWADLRSRTRQNIAEINKCDLYLTEGRSKPLSHFELRVARLCKFDTTQKPPNKSIVPPTKPICNVAVVTPNSSSTSPPSSSSAQVTSPSSGAATTTSTTTTTPSVERAQKPPKRKISKVGKQRRLAYVSKELELLQKQVATQEAIVIAMESQVKLAKKHNKALRQVAEATKLIASSISEFTNNLK